MTIDQRAARATKMRNKITAEKFPLFADDFATTPDAERMRIMDCIAQQEVQIAQLDAFGDRMLVEGEAWRQLARTLMDEASWSDYDAHFRRVITFQDPTYFCDWWHRKCRELGVDDLA
jgi:hypothetical protein